MTSQDAFFDSILDRLAGQLDPRLFEESVCEILQQEFPGLFPIPGGSDFGMDGAVADGDGEAFPAIVTTAEDVSRNLRRSLESYLAAGGERRLAVLVTSQSLTAKKRRNLEQRARERGFTLVQVVTREGIASRLYRHPSWCQRLLGLTGDPPALSALPPSSRALVEVEPVGRSEEIAWLRETEGDRFLVGQPGSGKTFLLYQLARLGIGLFVASSDAQAIANGIRELQPPALLVDDAHLEPERLVRLRHLREELGADFRIIATTWPSAQEQVNDALGGLATTKVRVLEGLTRNEIVEVYRRAGVKADDPIMRELVDQAANQPGLAMTLAQIYLRGEWSELFTGNALHRSVTTLFDRLVGDSATPLLATFALGGTSGMTIEAASGALGLPSAEVWRDATHLAAGGVLAQARGRAAGWTDHLVVRPKPLRAALVGATFFGQGPRLPLDAPLAAVSSREASLEVLLSARARGADIPEQLLREELQSCRRPDLWNSYACLGRAESRWVLDHYSRDLVSVIKGALLGDPELAVPALLDAVQDRTPTTADEVDDLLQPLTSWLRQMPYFDWQEEAMRRRRVTVEAAVRYLHDGGSPMAGTAAICSALRPDIEFQSADPGMGDRISLHFGRVSGTQMQELRSLLPAALAALPAIDGAGWRRLHRLVEAWSHPGLPVEEAEERRREMQGFAAAILKELAPQAAGRVGFTSALVAAARRLDLIELDLGLVPGPTFELLFGQPSYVLDDGELERKAQIDDLANEWARRSPDKVLQEFEDLWAEARVYLGPSLSRWVFRLWPAMAKEVAQPEHWLDLAMEKNLPAIVAGSLLRATVDRARPGWNGYVDRCLKQDSTRWTAVEVLLKLQSPPTELLNRVMADASSHLDLIDTLTLRRELALDTLRRLLKNEDWRVAAAAAIGEWNAGDTGNVRSEVAEEWRRAILRTQSPNSSNDSVSYWLAGILASDSDLAFDWLKERLTNQEELPWSFIGVSSPGSAAVHTLDHEQRSQLLAILDSAPLAGRLCAELVGEDLALYRQLLARRELADHALAPLKTFPTPEWTDLALEAVRTGHSPEDVAWASFVHRGVIAGSGIDHWTRWLDRFTELSDSPEVEIQSVAAHGISIAQQHIRNAETRWKQIEREGF